MISAASAKAGRLNRIYFMGVSGIAMGTLACMLKDDGYDVVGSDTNVYPPMSTFLEEKSIPVLPGWNPENLLKTRPDAVVVGNVIRKDNPEVSQARALGVPVLSMPQALDRFFLHSRKSLVVCGTHGKTTTTGLLGWLLESAGLDPTVFVGGFVKGWGRSYRIGRGPFMVVEGDEYDTVFFDKQPKFLHYKPWVAVVTSIEFDHADIYRDVDHVTEAFRALSRIVPNDGFLVVNGDDPRCLDIARSCPGTVITYGTSPRCLWRLEETGVADGMTRFRVVSPDGEAHLLSFPLPGRHNALNAVAATAVCRLVGLSMEPLQSAVAGFSGMKRRQEVIYDEDGVLVLDDFAHHPTAVRETLKAIRTFHSERRLLAVFEPRTNSSRRRFFQKDYADVFRDAHWVGIKEPAGFHTIPLEERLDTVQLVQDIRKEGIPARLFQEGEAVVPSLLNEVRHGDVVVLMSNGSMDGLPAQFCEALRERCRRRHGPA
ncbi:UDP-N-acetylmuramate--L-alanine ligase [Desulfosoma sp.]